MVFQLLRVVGILLMLTALAVPLARAPDRAPETLVARWAPSPSTLVDVQGMPVHLRDEGPRGDPRPLLLLHGLGSSLHSWDGWASVLSERHRVLRLDLPGAGLTGPWAGALAGNDYRAETQARLVLALMDQLRLSKVVLVGHSLGGEVAWHLALLAPQRVDRLLLIDATGTAVEPREWPIGLRLAALPVTGWLGEHLLPRGVVEASLRSLYADPRLITPALVDRYFELLLRDGNRAALRRILADNPRGAEQARLNDLQVPTLLMWGEHDQLVPPAAGAEFAQRIPGARLQVFQGLGHVPQEEAPRRSARALEEFMGAR